MFVWHGTCSLLSCGSTTRECSGEATAIEYDGEANVKYMSAHVLYVESGRVTAGR